MVIKFQYFTFKRVPVSFSSCPNRFFMKFTFRLFFLQILHFLRKLILNPYKNPQKLAKFETFCIFPTFSIFLAFNLHIFTAHAISLSIYVVKFCVICVYAEKNHNFTFFLCWRQTHSAKISSTSETINSACDVF